MWTKTTKRSAKNVHALKKLSTKILKSDTINAKK